MCAYPARLNHIINNRKCNSQAAEEASERVTAAAGERDDALARAETLQASLEAAAAAAAAAESAARQKVAEELEEVRRGSASDLKREQVRDGLLWGSLLCAAIDSSCSLCLDRIFCV